MEEGHIATMEAISNYGVLVVIAAIFLAAIVLLIVHLFKTDKGRAQREDDRYNQLVELTKVAIETAAKGNAALENSTKAIEAVQATTISVSQSVLDTNKVLGEVCEDLKEQRHITDKIFTELRIQGAKNTGG